MLCSVFGWVLVIHAILSWFVSPFNKVYQFLGRATGPLRAPFLPLTNKLIRKGLPLDLSGLCAMVALNIISGLCDWAASAVLFM